MRTEFVNPDTVPREWYVVDASEKYLGRLASFIAPILIGKGKPEYSPHDDYGDNVIVINAGKIRLTGKKADTKSYFSHSHYPGGAKTRSFKKQMQLDPTRVIEHAVWGMLPKNARGRTIFRKLHVYPGDTHSHAAQKPKELAP